MPRDPHATRNRLLEAATEEFAAYGIAGARVERIAAGAGANKNLIYVHFGSKEGLFAAVVERAVGELLETVPITPHDLPGYAGALFDFNMSHPRLVRLARWYGMERPGRQAELPLAVESTRAKLDAVAAAQAEGAVFAGLPPRLLLPLLFSIAMTWSDGGVEPGARDGAARDGAPGEVAPGEAEGDGRAAALAHAARRHAVVVAAERLVRPERHG
ncbi:TetR family transcriptional regulator [Streptomyces sp. NBC_01317]|uniref:TetR family transcriptional regulator n=1 Tax=Streptomyces sp. NBC_01317 TaxID=2903822 RepID=UPI002E0F6328|nr:TetR family transcriptional regulator [Streptomyces sp. NBC_01317]